jgi:hypothetical protein
MTVEFEGSARWPRRRSAEELTDSESVLRALFKSAHYAAELSAAVSRNKEDAKDHRIESLRASWPEDIPPFTHPADWRPSVRSKQFSSITYSLLDSTTDTGFATRALEYHNWLKEHMIIDGKAASMVKDVLMDAERGGDSNLRLIAFAEQDKIKTARKFEQEYLGLDPLPLNEEDSAHQSPDADLRICEDGLYGSYDFRFGGERDGGELPTSAIATALQTTIEDLNLRLSPPEIFEQDSNGSYPHAWSMIRTDQYLLMARPHDETPDKLIVGPVRELAPIGDYLLEEFLRAYEAGTTA